MLDVWWHTIYLKHRDKGTPDGKGNNMTNEISNLKKGDTIYWKRMPKGVFNFLKIDRDGSLHIVGGERGYARNGHNALQQDVSLLPFDGGKEAIVAWCRNNIFAEVTVKELAAIGECSEATVRSLINDRRDIFRKSDGRKYEVRDPQADRQYDK